MPSVETFTSNSEKDTFEFARKLALSLKGGECLAVSGDLGAGKTVFAKGLAKGLDISGTVTSPTFIIMNEYPCGRLKFYHFDMYRIDTKQAENLGFGEYFDEAGAVCLVEWPENVTGILPPHTVHIEIKRTGEETREITLLR